MRILHVSDLHASTGDDADQRAIVDAALDDITVRDRETSVDLIAFSGDLGFDGTPTALDRGRSLLLEPLAERLPSRPLVVVPGNHDVNRARISGILETGLRQTLDSRIAVAEVMSGEDLAPATARLDDWRRFETQWYGDGGRSQLVLWHERSACQSPGRL